MTVVRATISSDRIKHADNERDEAEVVIFGARNAEPDGTEAEWRERSALLEAERKREQEKWLKACAA